MILDVRRPFFTTSCIAVLILIAGCQPKANEPASLPAAKTVVPEQPPGIATTEEKAAAEIPFELEADFSLLTLPEFESFGSEPETWTATPDGFSCTGKPRGYLYSQQSYKNFTLRLEYRFPRPASLKEDAKFKGNTGFLVYITGEHKLWPTCIEIQGKNVQMAAIKENGGAEPVTTEDDDAARQQARKSVGQWNALDIVSKEGALNVSLNGTPISHSQAGPLIEGLVGVQSEDHPFEVRRMRIRVE